MDDRLQRRSNDLSTTSEPFLTASQGTLGIQVHLTALNAKMTLDEEGLLTAEFDRAFSCESPEAIQWAFQAWRDRSPFFPAISEMRALLGDWHRKQREEVEAKAKREERAKLEEMR